MDTEEEQKSPSRVQRGSRGLAQEQTLAEREQSGLRPSRTTWANLYPLQASPAGPSLPGASPALFVPKDEYLADLYHFATKEDTYANYFIHVSSRPDSSHPELRGH